MRGGQYLEHYVTMATDKRTALHCTELALARNRKGIQRDPRVYSSKTWKQLTVLVGHVMCRYSSLFLCPLAQLKTILKGDFLWKKNNKQLLKSSC